MPVFPGLFPDVSNGWRKDFDRLCNVFLWHGAGEGCVVADLYECSMRTVLPLHDNQAVVGMGERRAFLGRMCSEFAQMGGGRGGEFES